MPFRSSAACSSRIAIALGLWILASRARADIAPDQMELVQASGPLFTPGFSALAFDELYSVSRKGGKLRLRGRGRLAFFHGFPAALWQKATFAELGDIALLVDTGGSTTSDEIRDPLAKGVVPPGSWYRVTHGLRQCEELARRAMEAPKGTSYFGIINPHDYIIDELALQRAGDNGLRLGLTMLKVYRHNRADGLECSTGINWSTEFALSGTRIFLPALAVAEIAALEPTEPRGSVLTLAGPGAIRLYDPAASDRRMEGPAARIELRIEASPAKGGRTPPGLKPCVDNLRRSKFTSGKDGGVRVTEPAGYRVESVTFGYARGRGPNSYSPSPKISVLLRPAPDGARGLACEPLAR